MRAPDYLYPAILNTKETLAISKLTIKQLGFQVKPKLFYFYQSYTLISKNILNKNDNIRHITFEPIVNKYDT